MNHRKGLAGLWSSVMLCGVVGVLPACSDDYTTFCNDFADEQGLTELTAAINSGDTQAIAARLTAFNDLAASAPSDIRDDFTAIATAVEQIVQLSTGVNATGTSVKSSSPPSVTATQQGDPINIEELNQELSWMQRRSDAITTWTKKNCKS